MANALSDRSAMQVSYGSPYDRRDIAKVYQGMKDAYLQGIQAAPEWLLGQVAPQDPYTPGVLQSGPQDRLRAAGLHREQQIAQRRQDIGRDYEQGMDYGTALGMIADPYLDLPLAGVAKLAKVGQATRAQAKPFNALSDLARDEAGVIRAYHGTPHEVDKFSMANIGTGEGAQAYGHGLYFAENPQVAKEYAEQLGGMGGIEDLLLKTGVTSGEGSVYGRDLTSFIASDLNIKNWDVDAVANNLEKLAKADPNALHSENKAMLDAAKALRANKSDIKRGIGNQYEVDLDVNPEDLLDWDKPLSKQSNKFKEAIITKYGEETLAKLEKTNWSGGEFYNQFFGENYRGGGEVVSAELKDMGVQGVRYLDQGSRGKFDHVPISTERRNQVVRRMQEIQKRGAQSVDEMKELDTLSSELARADADKQSRNVVMFDENLINILGKE